MRRYGLFRALPLSFGSSDLYRDVARSWKGAGLLYLLLLVTIVTLLILVQIEQGALQWAHDEAPGVTSEIPRIVIRHRVVEFDRPMPFVMRMKSGAILAVVDTNATIDSLQKSGADVLLNADHLVLRHSPADMRVYSLAGVKNFVIDKDRVRRWLRMVPILIVPVVAPFILVGLFLFRAAQQLLFAALGMLIGRGFGVRADFGTHMRLAALALTPAIMVEVLLDQARITPSVWPWLWTAIVIAYLAWAERSNRPQPEVATQSETSEPPAPV